MAGISGCLGHALSKVHVFLDFLEASIITTRAKYGRSLQNWVI